MLLLEYIYICLLFGVLAPHLLVHVINTMLNIQIKLALSILIPVLKVYVMAIITVIIYKIRVMPLLVSSIFSSSITLIGVIFLEIVVITRSVVV